MINEVSNKKLTSYISRASASKDAARASLLLKIGDDKKNKKIINKRRRGATLAVDKILNNRMNPVKIPATEDSLNELSQKTLFNYTQATKNDPKRSDGRSLAMKKRQKKYDDFIGVGKHIHSVEFNVGKHKKHNQVLTKSEDPNSVVQAVKASYKNAGNIKHIKYHGKQASRSVGESLTFKELRAILENKTGKYKGVPYYTSKKGSTFALYVDDEKIDIYKSEQDAVKAAKEFIDFSK